MVKLKAPWDLYREKIAAAFLKDPSVSVLDIEQPENDERLFTLTIKTSSNDKSSALKSLLIDRYSFGNVLLRVNVVNPDGSQPVPMNATSDVLLKIAFDGNSLFCKVFVPEDPFSDMVVYCVMSKEIVQYYTDNINDYYGNSNEIAASLMSEIFREKAHDNRSIWFCTKADKDE